MQSSSSKCSTQTIWITGLAGAGKTSIASALVAKWKQLKPNVVLIDGDIVREICDFDLGHETADRIKNAYRVSRICQMLNRQNIDVICATMSLYPEIWSWNRANLPGYRQVYLKVSLEQLCARDKKQLYSQNEAHVVGLTSEFAEPVDNDLVIENNLPTAEFANDIALEIFNRIGPG